MTKHTFNLDVPEQRMKAMAALRQAPEGYICEVKERTRSNDQNALFWSLLTELSIAKPEGRAHTPDTWKVLVMHACGHACQFEQGLNGQPFPIGFSSSRLSVREMRDLIDWIYAYGSEHGVVFTDPRLGDERNAA